MPFITALDKNTIRSIHTGQVITSTESIVKELLENSLDANANTIDIRLVNEGLQKIEVRDNGCGIALQDRSNMARQHYTSKLRSYGDLDRVETYGFRGEALSSLCEISGEVFITTKTKQDTVAICYKLNRDGSIASESASGSIPQTGTMVSIYQPFLHLPVRRQVAEKTKANTVKRIHELVIKYGLSHPFTRLSLNQQLSTLGKVKGQPAWIKPITSSLENGVRIIYGATLASMVEECSFEESFDQQVDMNDTSAPSPIRLHCLLPSKSSDPSQIFKGERVFIYIDKRPINYAKSDLKELVALVRQRYKKVLGLEDDSKKTPFMYIDIQTGTGGYDVNIEPDKSVVMFVGKDRLMNTMQQLLDRIYGSFFHSKPLHSSDERLSPNNNPTIQEVPCRSPELFPQDFHPPSALQKPRKAASDTEMDELDSDVSESGTRTPPLLSDWLRQQSLTDDIHEAPATASQSTDNLHLGNSPHAAIGNTKFGWQVDDESDMATAAPLSSTQIPAANLHAQDQPRATTENASLGWQIDKESNVTATVPSPTPQIDQPSDTEPTSQLSTWFAQFRRPSNSDTNTTKRPAPGYPPTSSPQSKRPRVQLSLPFSPARPMSPTSDSSVPVSPQQSPNLTNARLDTSPATIPSMIPTTLTQSQDIFSKKSSQNPDIFTTTSGTNRRRDIAALFSKTQHFTSSGTQNQEHTINMTCTLNETTTLESSTTMADMATSYNLYRQRYTQLHRKPVTEYHQLAVSLQSATPKDQLKQSTWNALLFGNKTYCDLAAFTQGISTDIGWVETSLAVMNTKMLQQQYKFQTLMAEYKVKCGAPLAIPAQMKISDTSPLYGVIISLDKKEECVATDGHGQTQQTYSSITDKRITANGFRARWRKEPYAHELVVQLTAIADLNGYGPNDFNEILELIGYNLEQQEQGNQMHDDMNGKTLATLKNVRPAKVVKYFVSVVKDMSNTSLEKPHESDWEHMLASLDEDTQIHFTDDKTPPPRLIHYLI